ncbi:efflux RND transporter permease subunit [Halofilum ochraceum]|uniref:efflux RND transporter permease subunit n=1 Tax=Halofilum ochraceum TaxID=1611323 RepID=UPI000834A305|nr:efflux RND transporter permease subunit [Halofilum ochraceum]
MNLSAFSVRRPVLTAMVTLIAVVIGVMSLTRLPVDLLPDIEYPYITVNVAYPNASPQAMEELVAKPIENAVATVQGIEEITASTSEGVANVRLRFAWGTDLGFAAMDVRAAIDEEYEDPPEGAERPQIRKFDTSDAPIMLIGVFSEIDPIALRSIIDNRLSYRIQQVPGVAQTDLWGGPEREIQIRLRPERVQALDLPLADVVETLRESNLNRPGGSIEQGYTEYTVRVPGRYENLDEVRNEIVAVRNGAPVRLGQVAEIADTQKRVTRIIRINGEPGIRIAVRKQSGANTVEVAERLKAEIERMNADLPQIDMRTLFDTSEYIERSIRNATLAMLAGAALAIAVLLFFLRNLRATLVVATAIPVSVITTFALIYFGGFSLNLMTLGGLALGVGLMVDSAIVVLENIVRRHEGNGETANQSADRGASEVAAPVVAGTLTTVAIFVPMFFAQELAGQLFKQLAFVVAFALACALLVALTVVPMLSARLLRGRALRAPWPLHEIGEAIGAGLRRLESAYVRLLDGLLGRFWRVLGAAVLLLGAAVAAVPLLGTEFMPATDEGEVEVDVEFPAGTRLDTVERGTAQALEVVRREVPELINTVTSVGSGSYRPSESAEGEIRISLPSRAERERSSAEVAADLRAEIGPVAGAEVRVRTRRPFFLRALSSGEESLAIEVRGYEFETLEALAHEVQRRIRDIEGIVDTRLSREGGEQQQLIRVDRDRAADQGVRVSAVAETVETAISGRIASRFLDAGDEIDMRVQFQGNETLPPRELLDLRVPRADGGLVRLGNVASLARAEGPVVIDRKDQTRFIEVRGNLAGRDMGSVVDDVQAALAGMPIPDNYDIVLAGDYEEQQSAFSSLFLQILLAIALVYMVMASLYESFRDPLIVMGSVPLALIGVVLVLFATATTLNAQSLIGCVILIGIVVNNAILIVDQANRLRAEGETINDALKEAGRRRLRPILMTAMTTILALLPLAIGAGEGGETQAPLGRAVVGGLLFSTLITLVLIPVIYERVHRNDPPVRA